MSGCAPPLRALTAHHDHLFFIPSPALRNYARQARPAPCAAGQHALKPRGSLLILREFRFSLIRYCESLEMADRRGEKLRAKQAASSRLRDPFQLPANGCYDVARKRAFDICRLTGSVTRAVSKPRNLSETRSTTIPRQLGVALQPMGRTPPPPPSTPERTIVSSSK